MKRLSLILGLALFGCDDGDEPMEEVVDDEEELTRCEEETRDDPFHLGIERQGEVMRMTFTDAEPSTPVRGLNKWTLAVADGEAPVVGAGLSVRAWMPDHGHGSPQPVGIMEVGEGEYVLDPVNLFMAGYWEITITAEAEDVMDETMFPFCVE